MQENMLNVLNWRRLLTVRSETWSAASTDSAAGGNPGGHPRSPPRLATHAFFLESHTIRRCKTQLHCWGNFCKVDVATHLCPRLATSTFKHQSLKNMMSLKNMTHACMPLWVPMPVAAQQHALLIILRCPCMLYIIQRLCFLHCGLIKTHGNAHEKRRHARHPACSHLALLPLLPAWAHVLPL